MEGSGLEDKKGNRGGNWEIAEESYLVELIRERKDTLEHKDNSAISNRRKDRAWEEIEHTFQAKFGSKRDCSGAIRQPIHL